jgi:hypothetical protein
MTQLEFNLDAKVLVFPIARRRDLVNMAAHALMSRTKAAGARWWRSHIAELAAPLLFSGMGADATSEAIDAYAREVSLAMDILRYKQFG